MKINNLFQALMKMGRERMDPYIRSLLNFSDAKEACKMVKLQAGLVYDQLFSNETTGLEMTEKEQAEFFDESKSDRSKTKVQKENTPKLVKKVPSKPKQDKEEQTAMQSMDAMEISTFFVLISFLIGLLFTAGSNIYSSLMNSGLPAFAQKPELAILISFLFPCSVFSVKFYKSCFLQASSKRLFDKVMYSLSAVIIINWIFWFSVVYGSGTSTGIDLENLGGGTGYETILMFSQFLCEFFVSTSLFLSASNLWERHSPGIRFVNHEHIDINKEFGDHSGNHQTNTGFLIETRNRLTEIRLGREPFVNEQVAKFIDLRGRLDSGSHNL